jgi:predicted restriction endonuclease
LRDDLDQIIQNKDIGETEKSTYINARVGQGKYRKDLINYWGQCALTGFKDIRFLVASHIKPWRQSEPRERLDYYNGLLLLPNLDKAFDLGFITFSETGSLIVSSGLENAEIIGIETAMRLDLADQHQSYMAFHREYVFERLV